MLSVIAEMQSHQRSPKFNPW